jgi:hypothetical protein
MAKKAKGGARGSADKYFVSNVEEPFDAFKSKESILLGSWWPYSEQKDRFKEYRMVVLAVDREWKANEKASPRVAFKAGLLHDDDPNFSHPGKELGVHYWFMTLELFSLVWKNFV